MDSYLQARAMNLGMSCQDFLVLIYLKNHMYLRKFKGVDICNEYPIFIKSLKNIQDSLSKLQDLEMLEFSWDRGNIDIQYNIDKFEDFFTPDESKIVQIKRVTPTKKNKVGDFNDDENEIIQYYKTIQTLPRVISMTPKRVFALRDALSKYSKDEIKEALLFASQQQWLINKTDEIWCDMSWILNKIGDFMSGGKYNKDTQKPVIIETKTSTIYL